MGTFGSPEWRERCGQISDRGVAAAQDDRHEGISWELRWQWLARWPVGIPLPTRLTPPQRASALDLESSSETGDYAATRSQTWPRSPQSRTAGLRWVVAGHTRAKSAPSATRPPCRSQRERRGVARRQTCRSRPRYRSRSGRQGAARPRPVGRLRERVHDGFGPLHGGPDVLHGRPECRGQEQYRRRRDTGSVVTSATARPKLPTLKATTPRDRAIWRSVAPGKETWDGSTARSRAHPCLAEPAR